MEILNPTDACLDDDFLNFTLEGDELIGEENESKDSSSSCSLGSKTTASSHEMNSSSFSELVEEELEWLSNKDAFPAVETCFGILSDNLQLVRNHRSSPTSVLEHSSSSSNYGVNAGSIAGCFVGLKVPVNFPVRSRTKGLRRGRKISSDELPAQRCTASRGNFMVKNGREGSSSFLSPRLLPASMGRRCLHCQSDKTPQWRAGPMGPKTLCNACGVRYKSGRLLPEYRPANSPTFSRALHSNSHRKVVEMRKQKQVAAGGGGELVVMDI